MFSHQIAKVIYDERQREIEQRLRFLRERPEAPPRLSIRKRLGLGLIRIGSSLASDRGRTPGVRPRARALAREPHGSPDRLAARR